MVGQLAASIRGKDLELFARGLIEGLKTGTRSDGFCFGDGSLFGGAAWGGRIRFLKFDGGHELPDDLTPILRKELAALKIREVQTIR